LWYTPVMTSALTLRDYQSTCIEKVFEAFDSGMSRPAVVLPTGSGKTVIFAEMTAQWVASHPGRVLILVHRDELVRQAVAKIKAVAPTLDVGVVKAGENDVNARVIVASVQTLARERRLEQISDVSLIIVDECHHAAAQTYQRILNALGSFNYLPTIGFTATMNRGDSKKLGDTWQGIVFKRDVLWMIKNGYLVDVKGYTVAVDDFELEDVAQSRGDFQEGSLGDALINSSAGEQVVKAYQEYTPGESGILFAPTVAATQMFSDVFNDNGITSEIVLGTTSPEERREIYGRAARRDTIMLVNCMVLTEGFDMPRMSVCVNARPTKHVGLYVQMAGRVLRPFPGKPHATILDVAGVASMHSLSGIVDLAQSRKVKEIEPGKTLSEAATLWDAEPAWNDADQEATELVLTEIDLFQRSHSVWLQTPGGVWFIPTEKRYYVLWPLKSGEYRVIRTASLYSAAGAKGLTDDLPLDFAMAMAEAAVSDEDPMLCSKSAAWRKGKRNATGPQINYASGLGINNPESYTKSDLSDMISSVKAGMLLDPILAKRA
jgi:superfamily II DNA or RNA helicase